MYYRLRNEGGYTHGDFVTVRSLARDMPTSAAVSFCDRNERTFYMPAAVRQCEAKGTQTTYPDRRL